MKDRILILCMMLSFGCIQTQAQLYGNEWINYNQQYFKFKVFKDNVYRIDISALTALGMPTSVNGANIQIFRDGNEIPIYVSNNGALSASDFIEFYGEKANGKKDLVMYQNPALQLNPDQNLINDTAFYFVTFNQSTNNKRYTPINNNLSSVPAKEEYYWNRIRQNFKNEFGNGRSAQEGNLQQAHYELNSSQYEEEGWVRKFTTTPDSVTYNFPFPYKLAGAPNFTYTSAVVGKSYVTHQLKIFANGTLIADSSFGSFDIKRFNFSLPMSTLNASNNVVFRYQQLTGSNIIDRFGISYVEYRYPSLFNFNNKTSYYFELNPKASDYYLEITNFNNANISPRLFDLESQQFLMGDISVTGKIRFLIPASTSIKRLFLQSQSATVANQVLDLKPVTFKNFSLATNQGDYMIVTHNHYTDDGTGHNYIQDYKSYRASVSGGGFNPNIALVEDIYNEFGYGYDYSSLAIKNYLHYAYQHQAWAQKPKFVFIIGKGIDYNYYSNYKLAPANTYDFVPIPSFGEPASDMLLTDFGKNNKPLIPIGRLSCYNGTDVGNYLQKVKDHEQVLANTNQTIDEKLWQKRFLHIAGASDLIEQVPIVNALAGQENRVAQPFFGATTTTIKKSSTQEVESINSKAIDDLFNSGLAFIQFFGHSSSSSIDYGLDFPENYNNYKRYPFFMANGCSAGDVFILTGQRYLSERFTLAPNQGAIGFIASVNTSFSNDLGIYTDSLYNHISTKSYGMCMGEQMQRNAHSLMSNPAFSNDFLFRMHVHQIQLNGDPAVKIYNYPKPDYAIENKFVRFRQLNFTTAIDSLDLDFTIYNIGRYTKDSLKLIVKRRLPDNSETIVLNQKISGFSNSDSFHVRIPTIGDLALGLNQLEIEIDPESIIDEISESNNKVIVPFTIYNDDLVPVYPYNFSIVNAQNITLKASTLNPFAEARSYIFQVDTTEKFNSPWLKSTSINSKGGIVRWQPSMTMTDSTVYYWRTAMDTLYGNTFHRWTNSSFIYLNQSSTGWNQSHVYQWQKNNYADIIVDSAQRNFQFVGVNKKLVVQNVCMNGPNPYKYDFGDYLVKLNGATLYTHGCNPPGYGSLQFVIIDSVTGKPWLNKRPNPNIALGKYGSFYPCRGSGPDSTREDPFFEFSFKTSADRKLIMDFLDSIPNGNYVMIQSRLCIGGECGGGNKIFVNQWKADTTLYGANNSLYHKMKNIGFSEIDSLYKNRPMVLWMKKGIPASIQQHFGKDTTVKLVVDLDFQSTSYQGNIVSTKIGPAKVWSSFLQKPYSTDITNADSTFYNIYGISSSGSETLLAKVYGDTSLAFINATQYPCLRIDMFNSDNLYQTPKQLKYWRVLYTPVPEAALSPNLISSIMTDTVGQGQVNRFIMALENLTETPMDSMLVKYTLIDNNFNTTVLANKRYAPLAGLDSINLIYDIATDKLTGRSTFIVEANPNNDQPEQYHPNNIAIKSFYVIPDKQNPVIDVTFDGVHILDKDIVSAKPFIHITLKDDNKYLALDDTSLIQVYMKYHGDFATEHYIPFDGSILKFIPASTSALGKKNQASIEFRPTFTVDGDDYVLIVKARDKTGNESGNNSYKVGFEIVTQASITAVLNYPNPFTTSTQFVFTLTGTEVPTNMKIQVLAPTGKVVREILQTELGPLHVGRNITEYRWPGDDQFGKPLANGVYLYRVVSNLHGSTMDQRKSDADKWIEKGFGKLYIMR